MRNSRRLVLGLVLMILSPLSWGEDVYYCVVANSHWISEVNGEPSSLAEDETLDKMTVKYDEDAGEILVKSEQYANKDGTPFRFACTDCRRVGDKHKLIGIMQFAEQLDTFALSGSNFYQAGITGKQAYAEAGTCTKF